MAKSFSDAIWCHICNGTNYEVCENYDSVRNQFTQYYICRTCKNQANEKNHKSLENRMREEKYN